MRKSRFCITLQWLGAMVAGGVVDYDPRDGTYTLPREHAAFLTRAATPANLAVFAQYIPLLGTVEDDVGCGRGRAIFCRFMQFALLCRPRSLNY
jgi:hypothetical protein